MFEQRSVSRGSLDGHWLPPAWHPRRDRGQRVLLRRRDCRYGSRVLLAPGALGPCSLLPTCSSFSYPLRTLAGQTLPTGEYDASYRSAAHTLSTSELLRTPLRRSSQRAPSTHLVEWASLPCSKRRDFKKGVEHIVPANGALICPCVPLG